MQDILILVLVNFIFYFRIIRYEAIIDDQLVPKLRERNFVKKFFQHLHATAYSDLPLAHFQRILVHTANAILIYLVFGSNTVSLAAALLWSVNPINTQGVAWLNGIGYSMSANLVLTMYLLPILSPVFYFMTLWWHLTAFPAPIMFIAYGRPWFALMIVMIPVVGFLVKWRIPFGKAQKDATIGQRAKMKVKEFRNIYLRKFVFVAKTYGYYFWLSLIPKRLGMFHSFGYAFGVTKEDTEYWQKPSAFFYFALVTALGNVYLIARFWGTPLSSGLLWFDVFIAQWCNVVIMHQTTSDRYCYLPSIGLMYALAWVTLQIYSPLFWIFFTFYAVKLTYYLPGYKNMDHFIEYNLIEQPDNFAAWNWKGILEREKGRMFSALYAWSLGLRHKPNDFRLNINVAFALKQLGNYIEAEKYLDAAKKGMPENIYDEHMETIKKEEVDLLMRAGMQRAKEGRIITPAQAGFNRFIRRHK